MSAEKSWPDGKTGPARNSTSDSLILNSTTPQPQDRTEILQQVERLYDAGICVIPARADGSKAPAVNWKEFQGARPSRDQTLAWFTNPGQLAGVGMVAGAVSGNVECIEIEGHAHHQLAQVFAYADAIGQRDLLNRLNTGWLEQSPSGGFHWFFRVEGTVPGNHPLARRPATPEELAKNPRAGAKVLTETRGEGGFVVLAPSAGTVHPTGKSYREVIGGPETAPTFTEKEAADLRHIFTVPLNKLPAPAPARQGPDNGVFSGKGSTPAGSFTSLTPGDDFEAKTSWADLLEPAGWTHVWKDASGTSYWRRPGKTHGRTSATTGHAADRDRLYVFSTNTDFPTEEPITMFHAYAILHHGGDDSAAAKALRREGYGSQQPAEPAAPAPAATPPKPRPAPISVDQAHQAYTKWLGEGYDLQALDVVLATAAVAQLDGDPVWTLIISGAGNAKTETVAALAGAGAHVESTITSEGALLSATSKREKTKDATGGLLRRVGDQGILVLKDFTSILSMNRDLRASVLAALREIYDGEWSRNVGTDGGQTLRWTGRMVLIGATTSAYDAHHGVVSAMGDRFALVRTDSSTGRQRSGRQALRNVGKETEMRAELSAAVAAVLAGVDTSVRIDDTALEDLLAAADLVTLARTAVERDSRGDVISAHAPEAPTRFAKMLGQITRGYLALGGDPAQSLNTALRVARDSVPPLRLELLNELGRQPGQTSAGLTKALQKPKMTIRRELDALHLLGLVHYDEVSYDKWDGSGGMQWVYTLTADVDPTVLQQKTKLAESLVIVPEKSVPTPSPLIGGQGNQYDAHTLTDFSGHKPNGAAPCPRHPKTPLPGCPHPAAP